MGKLLLINISKCIMALEAIVLGLSLSLIEVTAFMAEADENVQIVTAYQNDCEDMLTKVIRLH